MAGLEIVDISAETADIDFDEMQNQPSNTEVSAYLLLINH